MQTQKNQSEKFNWFYYAFLAGIGYLCYLNLVDLFKHPGIQHLYPSAIYVGIGVFLLHLIALLHRHSDSLAL